MTPIDPTAHAVVVFGARSLCGEALLRHVSPERSLVCCSRTRLEPPGSSSWLPCDLSDLSPAALGRFAEALPAGAQMWVSFAPLWLLAPFLEALEQHDRGRLAGLRGVVACSSSSVITKRFATNAFDRALVARLSLAQAQLFGFAERLAVPVRILAPTLIHGRSAHHADRNVETLRRLLRRLPLLPLPAHTGLRQPIAAADLVEVALDQARRIAAADSPCSRASALVPLGGDETLTYRQLLERIQASDPRAARCRLLRLPTRLFQSLAAPLLLVSPRRFEAVQRISADLAGFASVSELLGREGRSLFQPARI